MRWLGDSCEHLRRAHIRGAHHAHLAIRIRKRRSPFDRIVAVGLLVFEGIPFSLRSVAAANILNDDNVTARDHLEDGCYGPVHAFVIWSAHEDDRKCIGRLGAINVGIEGNAVARLHEYVVLNKDLAGNQRRCALRRESMRRDKQSCDECDYRKPYRPTASHALKPPAAKGRAGGRVRPMRSTLRDGPVLQTCPRRHSASHSTSAFISSVTDGVDGTLRWSAAARISLK